MRMNSTIYPIEYEAHVWNDIKEKEEIVYGIVFAKDFSDGMTSIEGYYGDELISVKLFMLEEVENLIYEFPTDSSSSLRGMLKIGTIETYDGY